MASVHLLLSKARYFFFYFKKKFKLGWKNDFQIKKKNVSNQNKRICLYTMFHSCGIIQYVITSMRSCSFQSIINPQRRNAYKFKRIVFKQHRVMKYVLSGKIFKPALTTKYLLYRCRRQPYVFYLLNGQYDAGNIFSLKLGRNSL